MLTKNVAGDSNDPFATGIDAPKVLGPSDPNNMTATPNRTFIMSHVLYHRIVDSAR